LKRRERKRVYFWLKLDGMADKGRGERDGRRV